STNDLGTHRAVTQHSLTARIGSDHAADRARLTGCEVDTDVVAQRSHRLLQRGERAAGAYRHLPRDLVDRVDGGQPLQAHEDSTVDRDGPAHQAGVATLDR